MPKKERSIAMFDKLFTLGSSRQPPRGKVCEYCGNGEIAQVTMKLPGGKTRHYTRCMNCGYEEQKK